MPQLLENKMFRPFNEMLSPEDAIAGGSPEMSADDILSALNKAESGEDKDNELPDDKTEDKEPLSEKKEVKEDTKEDKEDEDKEEVDELAELEEDLKEPTDEDLELKTPVQRRALMKDYPDIFKKHPGLESTIYRERAYTELLPTINDAKEALNAAQTLDKFEADLLSGNNVNILKSVKDTDSKAFAKIVDNYMTNLSDVDERAFHHVLGNLTKDIVESMMKFGKDKEDEKVQDAASILYQFMFNSTKWEGKKKLSVDDVVDSSISAEKQKLEEDKKKWNDEKLTEHTSKLMTSVNNQIKGTIEKSIDSKDQMTPFVKSKAIEEVLNKADNLLKKDTRFQTIVKQLTDRAKKENFSDESLKRIRSAYFTKYNSVLIPIVKAVRAEALKGKQIKSSEKEEETNDTTERANRDKPQSRTNSGTLKSDKSKPMPGESSMDFLIRRAQ